ncbi:divergent polysaccharide deacetylase family protein [Nautilia sp.]
MKKTKKKKKTAKKTLNLKYVVYFLLLIIFSLSAFIAGIIISQKNYEKELKKNQNSIKILQEKIKRLKKEKTKKEFSYTIPSEILDYEKPHNNTAVPPSAVQKSALKLPLSKRPKLVIIIDDVSFKTQVKKIKSIPLKITPSFFPPTKRHPNTPVYAKEFSHYMIHLPMEALHFHKPEPDTLKVDDSYRKILTRITEVKKLFPKAKFINNHTGSTFTADPYAMVRLFRALKKENLGFVDSKTTPYSKSSQADKIYHIPLFARNIFLDNKEDPSYIRKQLEKAAKLAEKHGYAIAIGHPHSVTLETLKNSADLLKNVDVVYIDELSQK